jgi:hypothetical protein
VDSHGWFLSLRAGAGLSPAGARQNPAIAFMKRLKFPPAGRARCRDRAAASGGGQFGQCGVVGDHRDFLLSSGALGGAPTVLGSGDCGRCGYLPDAFWLASTADFYYRQRRVSPPRGTAHRTTGRILR